MKRIVFILLMLTVAAGFAAAQEDGIGLTAGLEVGFGDVADEAAIEVIPSLEYENSFLDGALDLYAGLAYGIGFTKEPNADGDEVFPQVIGLEEEAAYNLFLSEASTLSFIVNNVNGFILSPRFDNVTNAEGILTPGVKFNQALDFGDLYAQADFPVAYLQKVKDADLGLGIDVTLGWASTFGLGIELTGKTIVLPDTEETGYAGLDLTISYETGPVAAEVAVELPKEFEVITITPQVDYSFNAFTFYANCALGNINAPGDDAKLSITPAIGAKFSF